MSADYDVTIVADTPGSTTIALAARTGPVLRVANGTLTLKGVAFVGSADAEVDSIVQAGPGATVVIDQCDFTDLNFTRGALVLHAPAASSLLVRNTGFTNCTSRAGGAAIHAVAAASPRHTAPAELGDWRPGIRVVSSSFVSSGSVQTGGVVLVSTRGGCSAAETPPAPTTLDIESSTFESCWSVAGSGACIAVVDTVQPTTSFDGVNVTLRGVLASAAFAGGNGAVLDVDSSGTAVISVQACAFTSNLAGLNGGAMHVAAGDHASVEVVESRLHNCSAWLGAGGGVRVVAGVEAALDARLTALRDTNAALRGAAVSVATVGADPRARADVNLTRCTLTEGYANAWLSAAVDATSPHGSASATLVGSPPAFPAVPTREAAPEDVQALMWQRATPAMQNLIVQWLNRAQGTRYSWVQVNQFMRQRLQTQAVPRSSVQVRRVAYVRAACGPNSTATVRVVGPELAAPTCRPLAGGSVDVCSPCAVNAAPVGRGAANESATTVQADSGVVQLAYDAAQDHRVEYNPDPPAYQCLAPTPLPSGHPVVLLTPAEQPTALVLRPNSVLPNTTFAVLGSWPGRTLRLNASSSNTTVLPNHHLHIHAVDEASSSWRLWSDETLLVDNSSVTVVVTASDASIFGSGSGRLVLEVKVRNASDPSSGTALSQCPCLFGTCSTDATGAATCACHDGFSGPLCHDACADHLLEWLPGVCGCGVEDSPDGDSDGMPDCLDDCPVDPAKQHPGLCGCGQPETPDSDGDGAVDCLDDCPLDAAKLWPGVCGCGVDDVDSDADGVADCHDSCPHDAAKTAPGVCGCGTVEDTTDVDGDGTPDCRDACPTDAAKTAPAVCGCGVPETGAATDADGDGAVDCLDACPADPAKTSPGVCGCGVAESDADGDDDGTPDCLDACPADPAKTLPGACGCGVADVDVDGDGVADCPSSPTEPLPSPCDPSPCQNGGTCLVVQLDGGGGGNGTGAGAATRLVATCDCLLGFGGDTCSQVLCSACAQGGLGSGSGSGSGAACLNSADGTCLFGFTASRTCPTGTRLCDGAPDAVAVTSLTVTEADCSGCWPGTAGQCMAADTRCSAAVAEWSDDAATPGGTLSCPEASVACASVDAATLPAPRRVLVLDLRVELASALPLSLVSEHAALTVADVVDVPRASVLVDWLHELDVPEGAADGSDGDQHGLTPSRRRRRLGVAMALDMGITVVLNPEGHFPAPSQQIALWSASMAGPGEGFASMLASRLGVDVTVVSNRAAQQLNAKSEDGSSGVPGSDSEPSEGGTSTAATVVMVAGAVVVALAATAFAVARRRRARLAKRRDAHKALPLPSLVEADREGRDSTLPSFFQRLRRVVVDVPRRLRHVHLRRRPLPLDQRLVPVGMLANPMAAMHSPPQAVGLPRPTDGVSQSDGGEGACRSHSTAAGETSAPPKAPTEGLDARIAPIGADRNADSVTRTSVSASHEPGLAPSPRPVDDASPGQGAPQRRTEPVQAHAGQATGDDDDETKCCSVRPGETPTKLTGVPVDVEDDAGDEVGREVDEAKVPSPAAPLLATPDVTTEGELEASRGSSASPGDSDDAHGDGEALLRFIPPTPEAGSDRLDPVAVLVAQAEAAEAGMTS